MGIKIGGQFRDPYSACIIAVGSDNLNCVRQVMDVMHEQRMYGGHPTKLDKAFLRFMRTMLGSSRNFSRGINKVFEDRQVPPNVTLAEAYNDYKSSIVQGYEDLVRVCVEFDIEDPARAIGETVLSHLKGAHDAVMELIELGPSFRKSMMGGITCPRFSSIPARV